MTWRHRPVPTVVHPRYEDEEGNRRTDHSEKRPGPVRCSTCRQKWPCDAERLRLRVVALTRATSANVERLAEVLARRFPGDDDLDDAAGFVAREYGPLACCTCGAMRGAIYHDPICRLYVADGS